MKGACPLSLEPTIQRETRKLGVARNLIRRHLAKCGKQSGDNELPCTTKVTGGSGVRISDDFDDRGQST